MKTDEKNTICRLLNGDISPMEVAEMFGLKHVEGKYQIISKRNMRSGFMPPTQEEFVFFFKHNGYDPEIGVQAFLSYSENGWRDSNNKSILNWKMKCRQVWFKPNHKIKEQATNRSQSAPAAQRFKQL